MNNREPLVPRCFKPDRKPGRPSKKDRESIPSAIRFPEKEYRELRKIQKQGSDKHYTWQQWQALLHEYGNRCVRCLRSIENLTADHVVPMSRGGSDGIENIQPLCKHCNPSKGTKTIDYRPGFAFEVI